MTTPETAPTTAQRKYAESLRAKLREHCGWTWDHDLMRPQFLPAQPLLFTREQMAVLREEGRTDEMKTLRQRDKVAQRKYADAAMAAYLARREELAAVDLSTLDRIAMSAWIDEAKAHEI